MRSRKGQIRSIILAVILLFIVGIFLFFMNHLTDSIYTEFDQFFDSSDKFNNTETHLAINDIQGVENSAWDFAFLAIYTGFIIQMVIFSFATRIHPAFFWLFVVVGILVLVLGTSLSNMWQETVLVDEFSSTLERFPITNALLGSYFPIGVTAILLIILIVTFGKLPNQQNGGFG